MLTCYRRVVVGILSNICERRVFDAICSKLLEDVYRVLVCKAPQKID